MQITRRPGKELQSLQDRLRGAIAQKTGLEVGPGVQGFQTSAMPSSVALLLDISGSMNEYIGARVKKISELRKLAREFAGMRRFVFSSTCSELLSAEEVPEARGGTGMHGAFLKVKDSGVQHVVLITDGEPDSERDALRASQGLKIDVFYVGPDPAPEFLRELCQETGGQYGRESLNAPKELKAAMRAWLAIGDGSKGPINL